jgi:hypothetical protein
MWRFLSDEKMNLPSGSYQWNKAILGAFKKGAAAHQSGSPIEASLMMKIGGRVRA